ncbi:MAG: DMT family transporter [Bacteriovoracaceae bacterium]
MKGIVFVLGACFLWALDTLIRYPLLGEGASALHIVLTEHFFLCLFFMPFLFKSFKKIFQLTLTEIFYFFVVGFLASGIGTLAFTSAMGSINPSLVIILQKFQPIVAIVLARVVLKEKIEGPFLRWAGLCFIGGLLISSKDIMAYLESDGALSGLFQDEAFWGYLFTFVAVFCWGAATVFGKKLTSSGFSVPEVMMGRFFAAFIGLIPLCASSYDVEFAFTFGPKIILMVVLSGLMGMWFYYQGLKEISAKLCTLIEMFFPFFAVVLNWIVLGATLDVYQVTGALILLAGSVVIEMKHY